MKRIKRVVALLLAAAMTVSLTGCGLFETMSGMSKDKPTSFSNVNDLESGKAYVWKDAEGDDINKAHAKDVFFTCITGDINFKGDEMADVYQYPRSIWMGEADDKLIPTVTSKDKLLYVSETTVPTSIIFERFADYGYTIGVSNMIADGGDHYYIPYAESDESDYKYYVDMQSDAAQIIAFDTISRLYLDKVGKERVNKDTTSDGGTVTGLTKGKSYVCEFYTGTFYQDFKLTANIHSFGTLERFVSFDYEFLHSNCIAITIPEYFKSGYYFVNGVGLFRYVSDEDLSAYNGEAYDENIDWNDPIIIYDENGFVVYDPSDPDFHYEIPEEELVPEGDLNVTVTGNDAVDETGEESE